MSINFEIEAARSLSAVRELSENWSHRPAPNKLLCRPLQTNVVLKPVPAWKRQWAYLLEFAK